MLPGGGAFLDRLERNGLIGVVGEAEEISDSSEAELLRLDGEGGATASTLMAYRLEFEALFMMAPSDAVVATESWVVCCCDAVLEGSGAIFRARTGSTDGITAAAAQQRKKKDELL